MTTGFEDWGDDLPPPPLPDPDGDATRGVVGDVVSRRGGRLLRAVGSVLGLGLVLLVTLVAGLYAGDLVMQLAAVEVVEEPEEPAVLPGPPLVTVSELVPEPNGGEARFEERWCPGFGGFGTLGVRCGFLDVPESRDDPEGRRVRVAVSIRRGSAGSSGADAPRHAVVVLTGGPGVPLLRYAESYQRSSALSSGGSDVIVLDQRGSGRSVPSLACSGFDLTVVVLQDPDDVTECARGLLIAGVDLASYSTRESAADIEDLRRALGYDSFDLIGLSYGSRLALEVVRNHPEGVRSIVLAGVVPPNAPRPNYALETAQVVTALDEVCAEQPGCRDAYGPLIDLLVRGMNRAAADGGQEKVRALNRALFDVAYWVEGLVRIPEALDLAARGDWEQLRVILPVFAADLAASEQAPSRTALGPEDQESAGLFLSVWCGELAERAAEDPTERPTRSRLIAAGARGAYRDSLGSASARQSEQCNLWGVASLPDTVRAAVESDVPALVLSGRFDPTTPPRYGDLAARTLPGAHVFVAPHLAHGLLLVDGCIDSIVAEFLFEPGTPPRAACLAEAVPPLIRLP